MMEMINTKKQIDDMLVNIEELKFSDSKAALNMALNALELSKEMNYPQAESILLLKIGNIYGNMSEFAKAIDYITAAIPMLELYGLDYHLCTAFSNLGVIFSHIASYETSFDYFSKSAAIAKKCQFTDKLSIAYNNIGEVYKTLQDYEKALSYYEKSYEEDKKTGFTSCRCVYYMNFAEVYYMKADFENALKYAKIALEKTKSMKYDIALCEVYKIHALIYWKLNEYAEAGSFFAQALDMAEIKMMYNYKIDTLIYYHQFLIERGHTDLAIKALTEAYALAAANNMYEKSITICWHFTEIYERENDTESALKYYKLYIYYNQQRLKASINQITDGIELRAKTEEIKLQSEIDPLTGISNRRKFVQFFESEWERSIKQCQPISIIMLDIDCFKDFNDAYGHPEGDKCLISISSLLTGLLKKNYLLSRYGGDEFIAVLPKTSLADAAAFAETMRQAVLNEKIRHECSTVSDYVTITLGVASMVPSCDSLMDDFIKQADDALYKAKRNGRNRVTESVET